MNTLEKEIKLGQNIKEFFKKKNIVINIENKENEILLKKFSKELQDSLNLSIPLTEILFYQALERNEEYLLNLKKIVKSGSIPIKAGKDTDNIYGGNYSFINDKAKIMNFKNKDIKEIKHRFGDNCKIFDINNNDLKWINIRDAKPYVITKRRKFNNTRIPSNRNNY